MKNPLFSLRLIIPVLAVLLFSLFGMGVAFALSGSSFEGGDGNLTVDTIGNTDWGDGAPNLTIKEDEPSGSATDDSFATGTDEDDPDPTIGFGGVQAKNNLLRFYVAYEQLDKDFLYLAWEREGTSGSANIDFEFNQSATTTSNGVTPERTADDILITYSIAGNGSVAIGLAKWVTDPSGVCESGTTKPCWGPVVPLDASMAEAGYNPATTFGEVALNLTEAGFFSDPNSCMNFGRVFAKSRSSGGSFTSSLKDLIAPVHVDLTNCGLMVIEKQTLPDGHTATFDFSGDVSGTLGDGDTTVAEVVPGTYTSTETVLAAKRYPDII